MAKTIKAYESLLAEWKLVTFGCNECGSIFRAEHKDEVTSFADIDHDYLLLDCPVCGTTAMQEVPLLEKEDNLFSYIHYLEDVADRGS